MPSHMHLLIEGVSQTADLKSTMKVVRMRSTVAARPLVAMRSLWQDGYWDRVLRPDEDVVLVADYIAMNPVRAGLVERPEDYPYVFSKHYKSPNAPRR
jgi:putative transposase